MKRRKLCGEKFYFLKKKKKKFYFLDFHYKIKFRLMS